MRRKVKTFLLTVINSIVPQNIFYARMIKQKIMRSVKYFLVLVGLVSLVSTGILMAQVQQNRPERINKCIQYSLRSIPENFALHLQNGILSTNNPTPLFIWFNCNEKFSLLGVIDERSTKEDIFSYGAQVLATGSELVIRYKSYIVTFPYKEYVPTFEANKSTFVDLLTKGIDALNVYMPILVFSILFLTPLSLYLLNTVFLFVSSFFVLIFYKVLRRHYSYLTVLHVGIHSSTLPIVTSVLFLLFPVHVFNFLILYLFLIFIFQLVGVYEAHYMTASTRHK